LTSTEQPAPDWPALLDHLVNRVFIAALDGDVEITAALGRCEGGVRLDGADLVFTVPALWHFLLAHNEVAASLSLAARDYPAFRRALYGHGVNAALRQNHAVVGLERADDDHSLSTYRLRRLPA